MNKIELAKLLSANSQKNEAATILNEIIADRNALRSLRWQARMSLYKMGENVEFPRVSFDAFSQFYNGLVAVKSLQTETAKDFFINSLIADKDAQISVRQELIKIYALSDKSFAALKLAESDKVAKPDELLEILSETAEKIGDFQKAIEFERAKSNGGNVGRIASLLKSADEKNKRATDFTIDLENTRKL